MEKWNKGERKRKHEGNRERKWDGGEKIYSKIFNDKYALQMDLYTDNNLQSIFASKQ